MDILKTDYSMSLLELVEDLPLHDILALGILDDLEPDGIDMRTGTMVMDFIGAAGGSSYAGPLYL